MPKGIIQSHNWVEGGSGAVLDAGDQSRGGQNGQAQQRRPGHQGHPCIEDTRFNALSFSRWSQGRSEIALETVRNPLQTLQGNVTSYERASTT